MNIEHTLGEVTSEALAKRVVLYFKDYGLRGIEVDSNNSCKVRYGDMSFVINFEKSKLGIEIIPPKGSEKDFEIYMDSLKNPHFYRQNFSENFNRKIRRHRKRFFGREFVSEEDGFSFVSTITPPRNKLMYLEQITLGIIDLVLRPVMIFGRNRKNNPIN